MMKYGEISEWKRSLEDFYMIQENFFSSFNSSSPAVQEKLMNFSLNAGRDVDPKI